MVKATERRGDSADTPKYQKIVDELRGDIQAGKFPAGKRLPGEDVLAKRFEVSLTTVRSAVAALVAEGLVETRPRSGSFVRSYRRVLRDANQRLAASQWGSGQAIWDVDAAGRKPDVDNIDVHAGMAPEDVADRLGTAEVWIRSRRYLIDNRPIQLAVSYLPASMVEGSAITVPNPGHGGIYARLAELGHAPVEFLERLLVRMPTAAEAAELRLATATPVAQIRREARTAEGRLVEVNDMVCAGDAYVFQWTFPST